MGVLLLGLIFVTLNFERGQGTFQLNSYWENFIRGAFLLIVVVFQSRLARRIQVPGWDVVMGLGSWIAGEGIE